MTFADVTFYKKGLVFPYSKISCRIFGFSLLKFSILHMVLYDVISKMTNHLGH
jgi:hypothetical protein